MWWSRLLIVPVVVASLQAPAQAGIFFRRTPKPDPAERVPALLATLRGDPDERKRANAAEELRHYDPKSYPDLLPSLVNALQADPSSAVRNEAASSIGKLRPISQLAGYALEQALANDSSMRVRMAARSALWQYHLYGYRSNRPAEGGNNQTSEPPLATPSRPAMTPPTGPAMPPQVPIVQPPTRPVTPAKPVSKRNQPPANPMIPRNQTSEPPLAPPLPPATTPQIPDAPAVPPMPLPQAPNSFSAPTPAPGDDGPSLGSPK